MDRMEARNAYRSEPYCPTIKVCRLDQTSMKVGALVLALHKLCIHDIYDLVGGHHETALICHEVHLVSGNRRRESGQFCANDAAVI